MKVDPDDMRRMVGLPGQSIAEGVALTEAAREIEEWRSCARYDVLMEGPRFAGWDRSQMDRCRKEFCQ